MITISFALLIVGCDVPARHIVLNCQPQTFDVDGFVRLGDEPSSFAMQRALPTLDGIFFVAPEACAKSVYMEYC
jgi:hypothetical protein